MKKIAVYILATVILFSLAGTYHTPVKAAVNYRYVSQGGNTGGECSIADPCTLQRAVYWTNQQAQGNDNIIYVEAGTYEAAAVTDTEVIKLTNSVSIIGRCNFSSGSAVCGSMYGESVLSGQLARRVIVLNFTTEAEVAQLKNLTIEKGKGTGVATCPDEGPGTPVGCGGGILDNSSSAVTHELDIDSCTFNTNYGIMNSQGAVDQQGLGGAILLTNFGVLRVENSTFYRNNAIFDGYGFGGAIYFYQDEVTILNSSFDQNRCTSFEKAGSGCAIFARHGLLLTNISDNNFTQNNTGT